MVNLDEIRETLQLLTDANINRVITWAMAASQRSKYPDVQTMFEACAIALTTCRDTVPAICREIEKLIEEKEVLARDCEDVNRSNAIKNIQLSKKNEQIVYLNNKISTTTRALEMAIEESYGKPAPQEAVEEFLQDARNKE